MQQRDAPQPQDARTPDASQASGVRIVYCGGCNPYIDRVALAEEVLRRCSPEDTATVYISGCQRACASDHQLADDDTTAVVVAGEYVNGVPTAAADLADAVVRAIRTRDQRPDDQRR